MIRLFHDWFIGPVGFLGRPLIVYKFREWRHRLRRVMNPHPSFHKAKP